MIRDIFYKIIFKWKFYWAKTYIGIDVANGEDKSCEVACKKIDGITYVIDVKYYGY